jgi:hypothetical protein
MHAGPELQLFLHLPHSLEALVLVSGISHYCPASFGAGTPFRMITHGGACASVGPHSWAAVFT